MAEITGQITKEDVRLIVREEMANVLAGVATRTEVDTKIENHRLQMEQMVSSAKETLRQETNALFQSIQKTLADINGQIGKISGTLAGLPDATRSRDEQRNKNATDIESIQKTMAVVVSNQAAMQVTTNTLVEAIFGDISKPDAPPNLWKMLNSIEARITQIDSRNHGRMLQVEGVVTALKADYVRRRNRQKRVRALVSATASSRWARLLALILSGGAGAVAGDKFFDLILR